MCHSFSDRPRKSIQKEQSPHAAGLALRNEESLLVEPLGNTAMVRARTRVRLVVASRPSYGGGKHTAGHGCHDKNAGSGRRSVRSTQMTRSRRLPSATQIGVNTWASCSDCWRLPSSLSGPRF